MKLRQLSILFSLVVIVALSANVVSILKIQQAYNNVTTAQEHRQRAMFLANDLKQETEQLARLVRAYTSTGKTDYLTYYYDILAIRQGEKPKPENYISGAYWDMAIAGEIPYRFPQNGERHSLADRMMALKFSKEEINALGKVSEATERMKEVEQVAFAATQGLYDSLKKVFVSDGKPDLMFASQLVYSQKYNQLKSNLSKSVFELLSLVDERTNTSVKNASKNLERWIYVTFGSVLFTFLMVLVAFRVISRRVLEPIATLSKTARILAKGDYSSRTGFCHEDDALAVTSGKMECLCSSNGVAELVELGVTLDSMAESIEQDIKLRQQIQDELETANQKVKDATRAKSMFLANMSHEIRTPMNAIIGMAYLVLKTELTPRQQDYINKVHSAAKSLLGIINDILDFSKVEAGKLELEQESFQLEDVVANSLGILQELVQHKEIELLLDISEPLLLNKFNALIGDALRLGQIITNVLSNAVKFTHQGYVKLSVHIESHNEEQVTLSFSVKDTGIGMTADQIEGLYQEFTQADGSTTRKFGGTGLGLSITKRLVELMGGKMQVESEIGEGTCFTFNANFIIDKFADDTPVKFTGIEELRVLVVDDQPVARQVLCGLLNALHVGTALMPMGVDAVECGEKALLMVQNAEREGNPYKLLLLDWVMPGMDGAHFLKGLQQAELVFLPTIAVVSAYDSDVLREEIQRVSISTFFLAKPVLPEMLRDLLLKLPWVAAENGTSCDVASLSANLAGMRVLLVEDNPINQELAVELLKLKGVTVEVASHGRQALEIMDAHVSDYYDMILMDLQMPVMDGYETTRRLRADKRYAELPIVAMSAHVMEEERERCKIIGMQDHVSKPIEPDTLYAVLARFYKAERRVTPSFKVEASVNVPSQLHEKLSHIEGLNAVEGLRRAGNKPDLYYWLLQKFVLDHADVPAQIELAVLEERWEDAERLAHTMKGLLGSMGAKTLQQRAESLVHVLKKRHTDWQESLSELTALYNPFVAALFELISEKQTNVCAEEEKVCGASLPLWFSEFEAQLNEGNFKATDLWATGKSELRGVFSDKTINSISKTLDNFDFSRAKTLAESAKNYVINERTEKL